MCLRNLLCVLTVLALVGCDQSSMIKAMTSEKDALRARAYIEMLRENEFEKIEKDLNPSIKNADIRQTLTAMSSSIPQGEPLSVKIVGVNTWKGAGIYKSNITFEYEFSKQWLLANVAIDEKDGAASIVGFNVTPIADSLENTNRFRLTDKRAIHYLVLAYAVAAALFTLYVLVLCVRTKIEKRKWLWVVFILFGFGKFALDWNTGQWSLQLAAIQLFSASAFAPAYVAWTISCSVPIGAILFFIRKRCLNKAQIQQDSVQPL